ncbi:hypothetical protein ASF71_21725 [Deinococcus sp. Leaf326]|nr:hypothetical protein ASF71_21725 [Deinococcus sp. Leaf326]
MPLISGSKRQRLDHRQAAVVPDGRKELADQAVALLGNLSQRRDESTVAQRYYCACRRVQGGHLEQRAERFAGGGCALASRQEYRARGRHQVSRQGHRASLDRLLDDDPFGGAVAEDSGDPRVDVLGQCGDGGYGQLLKWASPYLNIHAN